MTAPTILIIDDGELDDVRAILESVGVDYTHWCKDEEHDELPARLHMLVTTGGHAVHRRLERTTTEGEIWIATADSGRERRRLLQLGYNYVVRRPVHPSALRMLVQCALYGAGSRRARRVAVGAPVTFRSGLRRRHATLIDLSARGCRLLCSRDLAKGTDVTITLPADLAGGRKLDLKGIVVRSSEEEPMEGRRPENSLAVRFNPIPEADRPLVAGILVSLAAGPAIWSQDERTSSRSSSGPSQNEALGVLIDATGDERRREPRASYNGRVAPEGFADQRFTGRDLSMGGLRVDTHPALTLGAHMRLMIEDANAAEPVLVAAEVIRIDEFGTALEFEWIEDGGAERLSEVVASLPRIDSQKQNARASVFNGAASFAKRLSSSLNRHKRG